MSDLENKIAKLREAIEVLAANHGCSDHSCITHDHKGMGTNGGCMCLKDLARGGVGSIMANRIGQVLRLARKVVEE